MSSSGECRPAPPCSPRPLPSGRNPVAGSRDAGRCPGGDAAVPLRRAARKGALWEVRTGAGPRGKGKKAFDKEPERGMGKRNLRCSRGGDRSVRNRCASEDALRTLRAAAPLRAALANGACIPHLSPKERGFKGTVAIACGLVWVRGGTRIAGMRPPVFPPTSPKCANKM